MLFLSTPLRGALVNSQDLIDALKNQRLAGAAIDVLNVEPASTSEALIQHAHLPNLLITPHIAWGAMESRNRLVQQTRKNILSFIDGQPIRLVTA